MLVIKLIQYLINNDYYIFKVFLIIIIAIVVNSFVKIILYGIIVKLDFVINFRKTIIFIYYHIDYNNALS